MTDQAAPLLRVRELEVSFSGRRGTRNRVVHGLDLDVARGEILAVVGESGSGKSVTALAMLGLLPRSATVGGSVRLDGRELLGGDTASWRSVRGRRVAMIFQDPVGALDPVFTVGFQLGESIRRSAGSLGRSARRARAVELLGQVGLTDGRRILRSYPHQLSGGQCQRVMIAMALASEPDVLIADEPTTALDVTVQQGVLDLLVELRERLGLAVVLITHDVAVVADVADRVLVMRHGVVVEQATVTDLFDRPVARYTQELLSAVPRIGAGIAEARRPESPEADEVVRAAGVHVEYRRGRHHVRAVQGVDLELRRGEVLGLVGESGSGKSTLARAIVGLTPLTGGRIDVLGERLVRGRGLSRRTSRQIGMVFQNPGGSLNPRFTVGTSIGEPSAVHLGLRGTELQRRVAELLESVKLPARWAARYPHELSGGQRQRVSIARAISLHPSLLVCDEPTSALDVSVQARILDLLRALQAERGFACLFVSHNLAVVDQLCDRVAVMSSGRIVEVGDRRQVLGNPEDPYTRRLLEAAPVPNPAVQAGRRRARRQTAPDRRPAEGGVLDGA